MEITSIGTKNARFKGVGGTGLGLDFHYEQASCTID